MSEEKNKRLEEEVSLIKEKLKELHGNKNVDRAKDELKNILMSVKPWEIPIIEQSLIKEGVTITQIAHMCNLHVELFREELVSSLGLKGLPIWHPLDILLKENDELLKDSEKITLYLKYLEEAKGKEQEEKIRELKAHLVSLFNLKKHYFKQQMLLFPYLERRGLSAVPRVLWTKEDEILETLKNSLALFNKNTENIENASLKNKLTELASAISDQIFRENNILYPTCWALFTEGEWAMIHNQAELIGNYKVNAPAGSWKSNAKPVYPYEVDGSLKDEQILKLPEEMKNILTMMPAETDTFTPAKEGTLKLDEGYLYLEEIESILKTLPFELTFIDREDRLRYFTATENMLFLRTRTTIGRKVELCHPPMSVHMVKKIIEDFRAGTRNIAEFWINMGGKMVHIRYFPVRNKDGEYLGTLEVVQDISEIQKLEGERRLIDLK
ncbi:MAG: DUF438 domain-containing protein [Thermoplasmata archaeon]